MADGPGREPAPTAGGRPARCSRRPLRHHRPGPARPAHRGRVRGGPIAFLTSPDSRKARNIAADPRVAISVTDRGQPFTMAQVRGRVTTRLDGDEAWTIIDEISRKYTGQPYPLRTDRVVFLVEADHARANAFG